MAASCSTLGMRRSDSWNWEDNTESKVPSPRSRRNTNLQRHVQEKRQYINSLERANKSDFYIDNGIYSNGGNSVDGNRENLSICGISSSVTSESATLDRPPRPPGIRKTSSKTPIYIEAGGVLIPESTYTNVTPTSPSSSSFSFHARTSPCESVGNMINNMEDNCAEKSAYLSKDIRMSTLRHTDSCESMDEKTKKEERLFNEFNKREDKSTRPGQGLVESFLNSLNPLDWMEWHYEYCNAPARRQHIISTTKKEVSNIIISSDQSMLQCVVSPADVY